MTERFVRLEDVSEEAMEQHYSLEHLRQLMFFAETLNTMLSECHTDQGDTVDIRLAEVAADGFLPEVLCLLLRARAPEFYVSLRDRNLDEVSLEVQHCPDSAVPTFIVWDGEVVLGLGARAALDLDHEDNALWILGAANTALRLRAVLADNPAWNPMAEGWNGGDDAEVARLVNSVKGMTSANPPAQHWGC